MKIIYDADKALRCKQEIEAEIDHENSCATKHNSLLTTFTLCMYGIICAIVFGGSWLLYSVWLKPLDDVELFMYVLGLLLIAAVLICFVWLYDYNHQKPLLDYKSRYTIQIKYYLAVEGKNILEQSVQTVNKQTILSISLEDENHLVSQAKIYGLEQKVSTAVTEETVDLEKGLYLIPYKKGVSHEN